MHWMIGGPRADWRTGALGSLTEADTAEEPGAPSTVISTPRSNPPRYAARQARTSAGLKPIQPAV